MKRFVIVSLFGLAMLMVGGQVNAATIDLISQTYHIDGTFGAMLQQPVDITSSVPPLIAPWNSSPFSPGTDLHADGGASGSSAFVDISASICNFCSASAGLVFRVAGASDLDFSYSLVKFGIAGASLVLSDLTTGVTLVSAVTHGDIPIGVSGVVPVVPSDIYTLSVSGESSDDVAAVKATLTAVPEPSTMLLLGSGIIGLVGFRRKLENYQPNA